MSEQQIRQIMDKLREQDKVLKEITAKLQEFEPVKQAFDNVMGFDKVAMWILKALAALGVAIGMFYGFINWIRQ